MIERRVEHSHPLFRQHDIRAEEVRGTSTRSARETTALLGKVGFVDVRQLGCPDDIFEFVLEQRALKIERRSLDERIQASPELSDLSERQRMQARLDSALRS